MAITYSYETDAQKLDRLEREIKELREARNRITATWLSGNPPRVRVNNVDSLSVAIDAVPYKPGDIFNAKRIERITAEFAGHREAIATIHYTVPHPHKTRGQIVADGWIVYSMINGNTYVTSEEVARAIDAACKSAADEQREKDAKIADGYSGYYRYHHDGPWYFANQQPARDIREAK